jgi:hypothetical protein
MSKPINITLIFILASTLLFGKQVDRSVYYSSTPHVTQKHALKKVLSPVEITTSLIQSDIYQSFIGSPINHRKLARRASQQVGDTLTFSVRNIFDQTKWNQVPAELVFDTNEVSIWVETESMDSLLTQFELSTIVEEFSSYLFDKSGSYSVDSTQGILSIMDEYFGSPPDVDMDGKLDILLLDIHDTFASSGSYVAGFFDPNDLTNSATSNECDLIYIDLYPSIKYDGEINVSRSVPTLAHEYQHLIHANYDAPVKSI